MLIIDTVLGSHGNDTSHHAKVDTLCLPFELRCKSRLRTRLGSGETCDIILKRGTVLRQGDQLAAQDGRIVNVVAAPEALLQGSSADPLLLARVAYHLGNRHVAVALAPGVLQFAYDHVLGEMVRGLGLDLVAVTAPFEPEGGAYGGGHGHSSDGEGRGPRIHDHFHDHDHDHDH